MSDGIRADQPPDGWPPAACIQWRHHHPAHGHLVAGVTHWCSPRACAKVARRFDTAIEQTLTEAARLPAGQTSHTG